MSQLSSNNTRIAKNTLFLYFRMMVTMAVSFFTVRVVLDTLGVVDYGLYNVVGGIVVMFSFLSGTLSTAAQRYFAYDLAKGDQARLQSTFCLTITIYFLLGILIFVLAETFGLWFLQNKLVIPKDRISSAFWVFQFSIVSFIITMFAVPFNALIIAHEQMNVYAYVSIVEVVLKLLVVYFLILFSSDKLILYALLLLIVTILVNTIYILYCKRKYESIRLRFYWEKKLFKEIASYSGWNLFGALAGVFNSQGVNIILNLFFGPVVNAARGIAYQISTAINQFVQNFLVASRPQITKYYALGDSEKMHELIFQTTKFSFLLLSIITVPVLLETPFILSFWLKEVPEFTIVFTRLILINALVDCLSYPLMAAAQATGKIKYYQSIVGSIMILNLPVSYLMLNFGLSAEAVFYISIGNSIVCLFVRLILLNRMIKLSIGYFFTKVVLISFSCFAFAYVIPKVLTINFQSNVYRFFVSIFTSTLVLTSVTYFIGLTNFERESIQQAFKRKFKKYAEKNN
ncbi:MAG: lipopolysaccharide biosynthesis protein [Chitinophagaceae bacterium]|nr:MAG: lipopolysaccharide biosynthesis protein [Chitinophagaceae bacterium]